MKKKRCFVISPIGSEVSKVRKHANRVFDYIIKPAIDQCGVEAYRSDQLRQPGRITEQMFRAILQENFCIAVLTGYNPNVFFELAVAQSAGKPAILLMEKGANLPFNIKDLRCIYYDLKPGSLPIHKAELVDHIHSLESQAWIAESLLTRYGGGTGRIQNFRYQRDIINDQRVCYLLRGIKETYLRFLADHIAKPITPKVRINIMAPSKRRRVKEPMLRIISADYISDYKDEELREKWYQGQGKCGVAWQERRLTFYANDINTPEASFEDMGVKNETAQEIASVLSTPIFWKERQIAILNMDSFHGSKQTLVNSNGVHIIFKDGARELASLLIDTGQ
ncbi:MAG TPA: hypothetical protein VMZ30_12665 [Pyrinomonadaceae bacterium]|nr:hypothetical protein [Pyrinomonadaceae bacterium]